MIHLRALSVVVPAMFLPLTAAEWIGPMTAQAANTITTTPAQPAAGFTAGGTVGPYTSSAFASTPANAAGAIRGESTGGHVERFYVYTECNPIPKTDFEATYTPTAAFTETPFPANPTFVVAPPNFISSAGIGAVYQDGILLTLSFGGDLRDGRLTNNESGKAKSATFENIKGGKRVSFVFVRLLPTVSSKAAYGRADATLSIANFTLVKK